MARWVYDVTGLEPLRRYRIDTASGSATPATITGPEGGSVVAGSIVKADNTGRLPRFIGTIGQLYAKPMTGDTAGTATTVLGGWDLDAQPSIVLSVSPSGTSNGATDRQIINAATARGQALGVRSMVTIQPGEWTVDAAAVVYTRQTVLMYGAKITRVGSAGNVIRNAAATPTRIITDVNTTQGQSTITSASNGFAGVTVGVTRVGVIGAGAGGSVHYGTVTAAAPDGSSVTLTITADVSFAVGVATTTAHIFDQVDEDITILGGHLHLAVAPLNGHNSNATYLNSFVSAFRRIKGLTIRDTTWSSVGVNGEGGKFTLSVGDCDDIIIRDTKFAVTAGDGIHLSGPINRALVSGVTGVTGDDMVVGGCQDSNTQYITDTQGPIKDWHSENIHSAGAWCAWKIYDIGTARKHQCTDISVTNVKGTCTNQVTSIIGVQARSITLREISGVPGGAFPLVWVESGNVSTTRIEGLNWTSSLAASKGMVWLVSPRNAVIVKNAHWSSAPAGTNHVVGVTGTINGSSASSSFGMKLLQIDTVTAPQQWAGSGVQFGTLNVVNFDSTANTTNTGGTPVPTNVKIANVNLDNVTAGTMVKKAVASNMPNITIENSEWSGTALVEIPASETVTPRIVLNNVRRAAVTNLVVTQSATDVSIDDVMSICSGAAINVTGGTGPVRVIHRGGYVAAGSSSTSFARSNTSTQAISVNGAGFPAVLADLTPTIGDIVTAAATAGTIAAGTPAVRGSGSWVGLAGGTL